MRLLAIALLLLSTIAVEGAERCLSVQQARAIYPKDHLSWRAVAGKRCWSTRRSSGKHPLHSHVRRETPPQPAPSTPPAPPIFLPAELAPPIWKQMKPDMAEEEIHAERLREMLGLPIYSTFAGLEPDVWPRLEEERSIVLVMVPLIGAMLVLATLLYARQRTRLRISV